MDTGLTNIISDLHILIDSSENDYKDCRYESYEDYLDEFYRIYHSVNSVIEKIDIESIEYVPESEKGTHGFIGTNAEIAKLKQVIIQSKKLLSRVEFRVQGKFTKYNSLRELENIFLKFHNITRQLRNRYSGRATLDVNDEYDVQDLLYTLLRLYFNDIRVEEWTPSYAGGCKRMDFLLKSEEIVIEVKKTRKNLSDKQIGEQLLIDISTYGSHPNCKTLVCFVYDPEGRISNPIGLENDLNNMTNDRLQVKTYIYPK